MGSFSVSEEPRNQCGQARHGGCVDVCSLHFFGTYEEFMSEDDEQEKVTVEV